MPYELKAPSGVKFLLGIVAVGLMAYSIFYASYKANKNKKEFCKRAFSSKIIRSIFFEGRTVEFHLDNGLKLYFLPPVGDKIMIGDSVEKKDETYQYHVFRKKETSEYQYLSTFDFNQIQ